MERSKSAMAQNSCAARSKCAKAENNCASEEYSCVREEYKTAAARSSGRHCHCCRSKKGAVAAYRNGCPARKIRCRRSRRREPRVGDLPASRARTARNCLPAYSQAYWIRRNLAALGHGLWYCLELPKYEHLCSCFHSRMADDCAQAPAGARYWSACSWND